MAFCNTTKNDLPKSIRSSLLKQANQRTRMVPYHERVIPPPVGAILDTVPSLGASVSSLSSGDTGAYDAPVANKRVASTSQNNARRPAASGNNRKDALQKHRRNLHHHPQKAGGNEPRKAPPAPEHKLWRAQQQQKQQQRPRPVVLSSRMQRQETRDEILSKARETLQRQEARDANPNNASSASLGKIDRNEILQLLEETTPTNADTDAISLSSRDFDIRSAADSKTDEVVVTSTTKPLNLPNRLPTKNLDLDSCFTGSTCSTITASVGYMAPHHTQETRVDVARRNHRRLEAAYQRSTLTTKSQHVVHTRTTRDRPQDPPPDTSGGVTPRRSKMPTTTSSTPRRKNDPSGLRRSTDSRAVTVKATGNRHRNIMRDDTLYSKRIVREDQSEREI